MRKRRSAALSRLNSVSKTPERSRRVTEHHTITVSYRGDATHNTSMGPTLMAMALPVSRDGCLVFGHGRITAAARERASSRGLVGRTTRSTEFYRDNGPTNALRVISTSVDVVTSCTDATQASVFGEAKINGRDSFEDRIHVH